MEIWILNHDFSVKSLDLEKKLEKPSGKFQALDTSWKQDICSVRNLSSLVEGVKGLTNFVMSYNPPKGLHSFGSLVN